MTIHVERIGDGPDLVLLHGWGLHGGAWDGVAQRLAPRFRLHVVDLPGHGRSAPLPFDDLDSLASRVAPVVPAGSAVCGWSLGSLVALKLASREPDRVRALGLVAATPSFVTRDGWTPGMAPDVLAAFTRDLARDRDRTVRAFLHLNVRGAPGARDGIRQLDSLLAQRPAADAGCLAAGLHVLASADLRDALAGAAMGTVVVHGALDSLIPLEAGRHLAAELPNATLVEIAGAAHAPLLTHPQAVAMALEEHLHG